MLTFYFFYEISSFKICVFYCIIGKNYCFELLNVTEFDLYSKNVVFNFSFSLKFYPSIFDYVLYLKMLYDYYVELSFSIDSKTKKLKILNLLIKYLKSTLLYAYAGTPILLFILFSIYDLTAQSVGEFRFF